jgi:hypothetical protein
MSTLLVTCIYSNLWQTEFGGRPSRSWHYKFSLLNILNLKPTKIICFTSSEEIKDLEHFFYQQHSVDTSILELRVFDLKDTRYFNFLQTKKNIEEIKKSHRCFEIQYNKLFWIQNLNEIFNYDRVYWFDAGLSHGGLFPEEYRYQSINNAHNRNFYNVSLFQSQYLEYLNSLTQDKIVLVAKNNSNNFRWSQTLPAKYYTSYNSSKHIVGGFFGGKPIEFLKLSNKFETLLLELLMNESILYMEEVILSCLYYNNIDNYILLDFDDWYKREHHTDNSIRYFYSIFTNHIN